MMQPPEADLPRLQSLCRQLENIITAEEQAFQQQVEDYHRRITVFTQQLQIVRAQMVALEQGAAAGAQMAPTPVFYAPAATQCYVPPGLSVQAASFTPAGPGPAIRPAAGFVPQALVSAEAAPAADPPLPLPLPLPLPPQAPEDAEEEDAAALGSHLDALFPQPTLTPAAAPLEDKSADAYESSSGSADADVASGPVSEGPDTPESTAEPPTVGGLPLEPLQTDAAAGNGSSGGRKERKKNKRRGGGGKGGSGTGFEDILQGKYSEAISTGPEAVIEEARGAFAAEEFPSLQSAASGGSGGGAGGSDAPSGATGMAWGGSLASRLQSAKTAVAAAVAPRAPTMVLASRAVEEFEVENGLRLMEDMDSDAEKRRRMRLKTFSKMDYDAVRRREVNIAEGLELHVGLLSPEEQALAVETIEGWVEAGRAGDLRGRTFSAPRRWMAGKGRVTMQFGCCYNYATDSDGRPPGIIPEEVVEPMPPLLRAFARRLVRWGVIPASKEPDSAIINIYEEGDCIPPHVDHFDFVRPFCSISLLSEQSILFASKLIPDGPGEFVAPKGAASISIPLPPGSAIVLKGTGGDKSMHCVPPVNDRRVSITLRRIGPQHAPLVAREMAKAAAAEGTDRFLGFWER